MVKFTGHPITDDSALGGSVIERSLRFNSGDVTHLIRTPSSAGNRRTMTYSFWLKRVKPSSYTTIISGRSSSSSRNQIDLTSRGGMRVWGNSGGSVNLTVEPNNLFRDSSAWYHFVIAIDTTQSTASNRIKYYVNGTAVSSYTSTTYPSENYELQFNNNVAQTFGLHDSGPDVYFAEINFIDGIALDSSYFGYTEFQTGLWRPKRYEGTYGTNGYYLKLNDNSGTTATTLGKDSSGNSNNFTPNNFSTHGSVPDSPTNNFCTLNAIQGVYSATGTNTYSEGNLKVVTPNSGTGNVFGNMSFTSGKWYAEAYVSAYSSLERFIVGASGGVIDTIRAAQNIGTNAGAIDVSYFGQTGVKNISGSESSYGDTYTVGDIIGVALDLDNRTINFYKNNTAQGTIPIASTGDWAMGTGDTSGGGGSTMVMNYGQDSSFAGAKTAQGNADGNGKGDFYYSPPSGFVSMCSANLPPTVPSIINPQKHFDTLLYTGNGSTLSVTGLEFKPDFVWIKVRSHSGDNHHLYDTVRGAAKTIFSNTNDDEQTSDTDRLSAFNINGFTLGSNYRVNGDGRTFVAWCWKAGGAAVANTDGTINTQVSVNEEAGFSIVTYTGNGSTTATIGHGLGKTPAWILLKNRSSEKDWVVMHQGISYYDGGNYKHEPIKLNSSGAKTSILGIWQTPNSSTQQISDGQTSSDNRPLTNASGDDYVAYFWAEIPGYSKFGSYTGNGNLDGTYVHLGFSPAFIMVKRVDSSNMWLMMDNKRYSYNVHGVGLKADDNNAEFGWNPSKDFLSDGFKIRTSDSAENTDGGKYIYMAFAEQPGTTPFDTFPNAR